LRRSLITKLSSWLQKCERPSKQRLIDQRNGGWTCQKTAQFDLEESKRERKFSRSLAMTKTIRFRVLWALVLSLASTVVFAQSSGAVIYIPKCAGCHGTDGIVVSEYSKGRVPRMPPTRISRRSLSSRCSPPSGTARATCCAGTTLNSPTLRSGRLWPSTGSWGRPFPILRFGEAMLRRL